MNFILSLVYAPFVFIILQYYDIKIASVLIFVISLLWLFLIRNKRDISLLFPLLYLGISIFSFFTEAFLVLKTIPLLIALFFLCVIFISYFQKKSMILDFAEKMSKEPIGDSEKEYIHQSTIFWFFVSALNVCVHFFIYRGDNVDFWLFYSSIGWYFLFLIAGVLQFLHRRFVFLRRENV